MALKARKNHHFPKKTVVFDGGDKRDRTADLLNAIQALSQLSYTPRFAVRRGAPCERWYYSTGGLKMQALFSEKRK